MRLLPGRSLERPLVAEAAKRERNETKETLR